MILNQILSNFGLEPADYQIQKFGSGLINSTFKVSGKGEEYILQLVNSNVFRSPEDIAYNLSLIQSYLDQHYPAYLFVSPLPSVKGDFLVKTGSGEYYRLFHFVPGSQTFNVIGNNKQAFEAAKQFGKFTSVLKDLDWKSLKYTLTDFHNLDLRFSEFKKAITNTDEAKKQQASAEIDAVYKNYAILNTYNTIISKNEIPVRVIHHDTKISNVLFDDYENGLCVIDLDTVMPGYFLSDVGDMMRTYLSAASEEEVDLSKVTVRMDIFTSICAGYLSEMGDILTKEELQYFVFAGNLMIYMQAIRFLTDFLNNDIYYGSKYPGHNLKRAQNQFKLLSEYVHHEDTFSQMVHQLTNESYSVK